MKTKTNKGYTLSELIIVIVIIAILISILIPTLSIYIKKTKINADKQIIKNINTIIINNSYIEEQYTLTDILNSLNEFGYNINDIKAKSSNNAILWDSINHVFCYLNNNEIEYLNDSENKINIKDNLNLRYHYFKLTTVNVQYDLINDDYSIYALPNSSIINVTTDKGFDSGLNEEIATITLIASNKDVIINTNSFNTSLSIESPNAKVIHYGYSKDVTINDCLNYECHATIGRMILNDGNSTITQDTNIYCLMNLSNQDALNINQLNINIHNQEINKCTSGHHQTINIVQDYFTQYEICSYCGYILSEEDKIETPLNEVHLEGKIEHGQAIYHTYDDGFPDGLVIIEKLHSRYLNDFLHHAFTITYTIPSDTPADSLIICDPVDQNEFPKSYFENDQAVGFSFKIINESTHNFTIKDTIFDTTIINALKQKDAIYYDDGYKIHLTNASSVSLNDEYIPYLTTNQYFKDYVTWLNDSRYTTPTKEFVQTYHAEYATSSDKKFIDYINHLIETTNVTMDEIIEELCCDSNQRIKNGDTKFRHVECEIIRLMLNHLYDKSLGLAFIPNTIAGWQSVNDMQSVIHYAYYRENGALKTKDDEDYLEPYKTWTEINPNGITVYTINDIINNNNINIIYNSTGNVISGGIALLWHTSDGYAFKDVTVYAPPLITIRLKAN